MTNPAAYIARTKRAIDAAINQAERDYLRAMQSIVPPLPPTPPASEQAQDTPQGFAGGVFHSTETQA